LLSFLQIDPNGSVNVSKLAARPHVTAGAGGFVDITTRARKIVYSGYFNAGARMDVVDGQLRIEKEGKVRKLTNRLDQVSFSGRRGMAQGQDVTYVTERCVMKLTPEGIMVTEIAPGIDLNDNIIAQSEFPLIISPHLKTMDARLFQPGKMGLHLHD
jgi:acyl CoA:acetate/3-ketoacid CoA transferase